MPTCVDCNGTGRDEKRTAAARKTGDCDKYSYIRCWTCVGNGWHPNESTYSNKKENDELR